MQALAIVYERDAGPGLFAQEAEAKGSRLDWWIATEEEEPPQDPDRYDAVIVLGSSTHADQEEANVWLRGQKRLVADLLDREIPLIGVCLGSQLVAEVAGTPPRPLERPEIGWVDVELTPAGHDDPVTGTLPQSFRAFEWHSYAAPLPDGAVALAHSSACLQAFRLGESAWGIQFHPEVSPEDAESWIRDIKEDSDATRIGIDPARFSEQTRAMMPAWNRLGRGLCAGFLDFVRSRTPG
jgi:GMP synthase (glutamine-hydrolysing)